MGVGTNLKVFEVACTGRETTIGLATDPVEIGVENRIVLPAIEVGSVIRIGFEIDDPTELTGLPTTDDDRLTGRLPFDKTGAAIKSLISLSFLFKVQF